MRGHRRPEDRQRLVHGGRPHGDLHRAHPEDRSDRRRAGAGHGPRDQPRAAESHGRADVDGDGGAARRRGHRASRPTAPRTTLGAEGLAQLGSAAAEQPPARNPRPTRSAWRSRPRRATTRARRRRCGRRWRRSSGGGPPQFLSTHPSPGNRQQTLAALAPQMMPYYEAPGPRPVYQLAAAPRRSHRTEGHRAVASAVAGVGRRSAIDATDEARLHRYCRFARTL